MSKIVIYRKSNGEFVFDGYVTPAGTWRKKEETSPGSINFREVGALADRFPQSIYITDVVNESGTPYATIEAFDAEMDGFFVKAPGGGTGATDLLGGIAHDAAAPTPGVSGKYYFTSAGVVSWISGTPTVSIGDEVIVVYASGVHSYTHLSVWDIKGELEDIRDETVAAWDNFDDTYLGAKATDPTVDNDGNALKVGAMYFNSVSKIFKVWDGSAWITHPALESARSQSTTTVPTSKLLDDELNKLNQWVGFIAQSPDWTIDSSYNVSIPAGNIDVYYSNKFYRITTAQSFAVHSGTDSICFDTLDNTIKRVSTPVIGRHVILGVYNGYKVQLNGYVKVNYPNGIIYNKILQSEINALIDTKINANYEKVLFFVNRGSVTANGATVTIGTGTYYFITRTGTEYSKTLSSPESFTLTSDQVLVFNTTSRLFSQKNKSTVLTDDCILLLYDSTDGYSQNGLWANSLIDNRITRLEDDYISLKIVAHIIRGGIEISGANVTVKAGNYYFESQYGVEYSKYVASDTIYTLSSDWVLVFDLNSKNFISQGKTSTTKNQIVLLFYDGAKGVVPSGIWATDVLNDKIINLTNRVSSLENQNLNVPSFINTEANATFKRLLSWLGSDDAHLIAQITDVHSFGNNKYMHLKYLSELNKLFGFDLLWNGGDIGLDSGETETQAYDLLQNTKNGMQSVIPFIYTRGNHDYGTQAMSVGKINAVFNLPQKRQFRDKLNLVHGDSTGGYGYFDNSDLKIRTYFANTSEKNSAGFGMSATQLQWFADSLANIQANWNVIIINHLCVDPIGRWISYPDDASGAQFDTYRSIMSAFVNKTSGNNATTSVSWNFTSVPVTAKLVCNIAGDSHFNNQTVTSGVNYIVRQGYGSVSDSEMPSGSTKDALDYTSQCLFDILAVKSNGTAKVFRIGAGGEIRDYEFTY